MSFFTHKSYAQTQEKYNEAKKMKIEKENKNVKNYVNNAKIQLQTLIKSVGSM